MNAPSGAVFDTDNVRPALRRLREMNLGCAALSASRHARALLESADLIGLFDVLVDGKEAAALSLPGTPAPALFLEAARLLGVEPGCAAVVEDAVVGVEAGRRGGFRLVVGLDRARDPRTERGTARSARRPHRRAAVNRAWQWEYQRYDPALLGDITSTPCHSPRSPDPPSPSPASGTGTSASASGPAGSASGSRPRSWDRCPWCFPAAGARRPPRARNGGSGSGG